jgi:site-specific DNA recombinase
VRLIFRWYVHGDESGTPLPMRAIARKLEAMQIPTPGENDKCYAHRVRGIWDSPSITTIIQNETYTGTWHYGKRRGPLQGPAAANEQIPITVPAIIDRETWEAAQARREYNTAMAKRNAKHDYLLRGLIKCGCQRSMYGRMVHDQRYYSCTNKTRVGVIAPSA